MSIDLKDRYTVIRKEKIGVRKIANYIPDWSTMKRALFYLAIMEVLTAGVIIYFISTSKVQQNEGLELMLKYGTKNLLIIGFYILYKIWKIEKSEDKI